MTHRPVTSFDSPPLLWKTIRISDQEPLCSPRIKTPYLAPGTLSKDLRASSSHSDAWLQRLTPEHPLNYGAK